MNNYELSLYMPLENYSASTSEWIHGNQWFYTRKFCKFIIFRKFKVEHSIENEYNLSLALQIVNSEDYTYCAINFWYFVRDVEQKSIEV